MGSAQAVLPHRRDRLQPVPVPVPVRRRPSGWPCCCCGCSTPATTLRWSRTGRSSPTSCRRRSSAKGFLAQSFFTGFGITLANISLFVFQPLISGATSAGIPYWVVGSFMLGSVCSIATVLVSVITHPGDPAAPEELAALRAKKGGLGPALQEIGEAIVEMPVRAAQARRWSTCSSGTRWCATGSSCRCRSPRSRSAANREQGKEDAVAWTGLVNGWYNIVTFRVAFSLVAFARKRGAKGVHIVCLLCAAVGLVDLPVDRPTSTCCSSRSSGSASPGRRSWACPTSWRCG